MHRSPFTVFLAEGICARSHATVAMPRVSSARALRGAVLAGDKDAVQHELMHDAASIVATDQFGQQPLHWAALSGHGTASLEPLDPTHADTNATLSSLLFMGTRRMTQRG
jgi:ankyrin repeat protein